MRGKSCANFLFLAIIKMPDVSFPAMYNKRFRVLEIFVFFKISNVLNDFVPD